MEKQLEDGTAEATDQQSPGSPSRLLQDVEMVKALVEGTSKNPEAARGLLQSESRKTGRRGAWSPNKIWIPKETLREDGTSIFKTRDRVRYVRDAKGTIRRVRSEE